EAMYPLRIESQRIRADSGGPGEFRGGLGVEKIVTALSPCAVQVHCDRTACPPWGILGGGDGAVPEVVIEPLNEPPRNVLKGRFPLGTGDRVRVLSGGGGGYAEPKNRDPSKVAHDIRLGYITRDAALEIYGVCLDDQE
ncbi:MAG: N-methylhydantoinase B, partial [Alphaproteobacteria bacterium]